MRGQDLAEVPSCSAQVEQRAVGPELGRPKIGRRSSMLITAAIQRPQAVNAFKMKARPLLART